jgi:transcription initiation factor TFIIB|uniref:Transcription factor TFIIB cyclin-like domain-containing protein n=1 Tax=viral metagenome TaxID=1070528 RepID=A0A6C0BJ46_9ZZZZ
METDLPIDVGKVVSQFENSDVSQYDDAMVTSDQHVCPVCHQNGLTNDDGVIMCPACYHDLGNSIDDNAEWRNYGSDDHRMSDPTRCGTAINPLLLESSYGTSIGYTKSNFFNHLKQMNSWQSMPYHERSLKFVFDRLAQCGYNSGLTLNIVEFSHKLFAEVSQIQNDVGETKLSRGDIRDGLIAACLFYACKEYEVSRSPQEIGKICGICTSDVTRGLKLFCDLMKNSHSIDLNKYITKYSDFIERYCNNLDIQHQLIEEIMTLGHKVDALKILTKNTPQAMACGCIFFIVIKHNLGITKTNIAEKCGISVPTITKSYERLLPYTKDLI